MEDQEKLHERNRGALWPHEAARPCACPSKSNSRQLKTWTSAAIFFSFVVIVLCRSLNSWLNLSIVPGTSLTQIIAATKSQPKPTDQAKLHFPLNCTNNATIPQTCPYNYPAAHDPLEAYAVACPEYFRWIHEDLRPWKRSGITRKMVETTKGIAHFRLVILNGKAYVEHFKKPFQTRDVGTIWGILQLLRLYPGKVPDLELMFYCNDRAVIMKSNFPGPDAPPPPPLFHYCGNELSLDISFPDWSFWGWHEVNIRPWRSTMGAIKEKAKRMKWEDRASYAYWKGNPQVSPVRGELMTCNATSASDWNARLYVQDWAAESRQGFKQSKLEDQCVHRYKIFVEGNAWSVSDKFIMACDSVTLFIKPVYHDFFLRGMVPMEHYWPIRPNHMCDDIKFAVEWGNNHPKEARAIGESGSRFIEESLGMKYVYDYMLHLLTEYAKLLKFEPKIPPGAVEYCAETMACPISGMFRNNMVESMVTSPSDSLPCTLPPPYEPAELREFIEKKDRLAKQVEKWEAEYRKNPRKKQ